jgi:hypothetical protein
MARSKYNNKKVIVDGIKFDSILESKYYILLKDLESKGLVSNIELQPVFILQEKFTDSSIVSHRRIDYKSDFRYRDEVVNETIVVDCKGLQTDVFRIKEKLFLFKYPEVYFMKIYKV